MRILKAACFLHRGTFRMESDLLPRLGTLGKADTINQPRGKLNSSFRPFT